MPPPIFDWFIDHHLKIMISIGLICTVAMLPINGPWVLIAFETAIALFIGFMGSMLYQGETSESWLAVSWARTLKNILGLLMIAFVWLIFVGGKGGVVPQTIASLILKIS